VGYVHRWCEAAYAFALLDVDDAKRFSLTELGNAFRPSVPGTLMPFAVGTVLGAHMAERATGLMRSGERPGESVLAERETILPLFGPMLEASFGGLFEREILPALDVFRSTPDGGLVVDLGCGNGWYLRKLLSAYPGLRGVGLDGFSENVQQAATMAQAEGLADRLTFQSGDLHEYTVTEPASLIVMNRALHHVWDRKEQVFRKLFDALSPGGSIVIWEPRWPDDLASLRDPKRRVMAFQNLNEHVQGNHFLRPAEIEEQMQAVGLAPETRLFLDGAEAVVVGRKPL
jgi:SAM-dependent methyltransferase